MISLSECIEKVDMIGHDIYTSICGGGVIMADIPWGVTTWASFCIFAAVIAYTSVIVTVLVVKFLIAAFSSK